MSFLLYTSIVLFILICLLLILIILIQKGRGGGLSSAFGGGGGGNTAFGSKTGDVLTWATSVIFGVFLILAIALNLLANYRHEQVKAEMNVEGAVQGQTTVPPPGAGAPLSTETPQTGDPLPNIDGASSHPQAPLDESGTGATRTDAPDVE